MLNRKSKFLFQRANKIIPGGVNSPVRAFKSVGSEPIFIEKGSGSKIYDVDGNEYIDYVGSWGPHLFGHNPEFIKKAIIKSIEKGTSFGAPTEIEVMIAELVRELVPSIEMIRFVNSGTEATMSAIRVARGFTKRNKIIKFEGCYHGHADYFLVKAGSGALTFGMPTSPGVTSGNLADTLVANFNDIDSVIKLIKENKDEIAAIIIEPVAGNMGVIAGEKSFIRSLRQICDDEKIVLIFDEVMTGFRIAKGGAQEIYGVFPDLTTFGKIIGAGLPVGAYGGKAEIMALVSPSGPIYQAGTLSGNPLAMSAGYAALNFIKNNPKIYDDLELKAKYLEEGMKKNISDIGKSFTINRVGSMMTLFFVEQDVRCYDDALKSDTNIFAKYFNRMLEQGIYLAPSQFEAVFISTVHSKKDLDTTLNIQREVLREIIK
jgi:glutamate-1-semialdehyde 2,1-aminomutase